MTQVAERHGSYVAAFEALRGGGGFGAGARAAAREAAFARFLAQGFPSTREEEWRFTNVAPVADTAFGRAPSAEPAGRDLAPYRLPGVAAEVVVVNGRVSAALSSRDGLPAGVTVRPLAEAAAWPLSAASPDGAPPTPFVDLNTALFEDGVLVEIAPGVVVERPIHVLFVSAAGPAPVFVAPRLAVVAGEQAQASIVETYAGAGAGVVLTSPVTELAAGPGAVVHHVKVQRESPEAFHLAALFFRLERSATVTSHAITLGSRIGRNDIVATLDGEGAECTLNGLYVAGGSTLVDTHTTIDHARPHCPSHEVYRGILTDRAKAVFNGKIIVRPQAQKTDAKQTNKALLLSDAAQINTKPQLEIFADDVKCTHGAAIGQLDDDALFYLRARGIPESSARSMLIHAFAREILDGIRLPALRDRVERAIEDKLAIEHED